MKKTILLSLILILNLSATEVYNIDDLTIKALKNAPDLHIGSLNYDASKNRYEQANAEYLPKINLYANISTGQIDDATNNSILGQLSLNQIIYDFGKTRANSDSFKYDAKSFSSEFLQAVSNKKRDVKTAYYNVLQSIALIDVHQKNVTLNESQHYRAKRYFEAGIRTIIDVSDAKLELLKSQLDLKKAKYDVELAYTQLNEIIGFKEIKTNYKVYAQKLNFKNLYSSIYNYPLSLKESVEFAYTNREIINKQNSLIHSAEAITTLTAAEYYPSVYFNANYLRQDAEKLQNISPEDTWTASINMDWNLYRGGASDARNQESKVQVNSAKSQLLYTKIKIKSIISQAYINVNRARDSVELAQSILEVSDKKFDQASKRYENGLSDFIELQQARQGYIDAMSSLVVEYYEYYISVASLDNAIGK